MAGKRRTLKRVNKSLPWKYCECGCHCFELSVGARHFTYFDTLKGQILFYEGHNARLFGREMSLKKIELTVRTILKKDAQEMRKVL